MISHQSSFIQVMVIAVASSNSLFVICVSAQCFCWQFTPQWPAGHVNSLEILASAEEGVYFFFQKEMLGFSKKKGFVFSAFEISIAGCICCPTRNIGLFRILSSCFKQEIP